MKTLLFQIDLHKRQTVDQQPNIVAVRVALDDGSLVSDLQMIVRLVVLRVHQLKI